MEYFPLHRFFVYNGKITPNTEFRVSENAGGVYEVLRVANGVPLFLKEHLERFFTSAKLAGKSIRFTGEQIAGYLAELISRNRVLEGNILLSCKTNLKAFFIPHNYPDEKWYKTGISCGILRAERRNPHAKVFQTSVRQRADELIEKQNYYEVLLINHSGRITEGSRSNVFFVDNGCLVTPPGNKVLMGITRQKTIQLANDAGIPFREQEIGLDDISSLQAAFITGTSPKILPVAKIKDWKFDSQNPVVQKLRENYDALIRDYIRENG